jgi:curved DNA-binding protein CbpA
MPTLIDPYATLGIARDASLDDIKVAYRRIARRLHPDVNQGNPGAAAQFQDVTSAYELLTDAQRKRTYDSQIVRPRLMRISCLRCV